MIRRFVVPLPQRLSSIPKGSIRCFSWDGHGTDLLADSLTSGSYIPKAIMHGHSSTGFDCNKILKKVDANDQTLDKSMGIVHLAGSVICFPNACYMWKVKSVRDLTPKSLVAVDLFYPKLEYLLLGSSKAIPPSLVKEIRDALRLTNPELVVEPMDLANAMGTFNILNGEDRRVCVALILHQEDDSQ